MLNADLILASSIFTVLFLIFLISTAKEFHRMGKGDK